MTRALAEVFSQLSSLPPVEQDRIAGWLQAELVSEEGWAHRFAQSQDVLNALSGSTGPSSAPGLTPEDDESDRILFSALRAAERTADNRGRSSTTTEPVAPTTPPLAGKNTAPAGSSAG